MSSLFDIQNRANVNTLTMRCTPFEASWAGLDKATSPEGNFATAHPQYYRDIRMKPHTSTQITVVNVTARPPL